MINKSFTSQLEARALLGFCSAYASAGIIERIGRDWDWCWIDVQHGEWGPHDTLQAVRACDLLGIFALVRVQGHDPGTIGKVLDTGCHAVMVPMVENQEQARAVVAAAKFAPKGKRSYGGRRPIDLYGRGYAHQDEAQPMVVCQIESPQAVERAEAIAATDGVDALFFGADDLALASGMPMDQPRPQGCFDDELAKVAEAAKRHGKIAGGLFTSPEAVRQARKMGYNLLACTGDVPLLAVNSRNAAQDLRKQLIDNVACASAKTTSIY